MTRSVEIARPVGNPPYERTYQTALHTQLSDHSFDEYQRSLRFTIKELGSLCLDVGSGEHELFAKQAAEEEGITVVSVNPKLGPVDGVAPVYREGVKKAPNGHPELADWQGRTVAALAQELPFKDGVFDAVVSLRSIAHYEQSFGDYVRAFSEIHRVLKPGRKAFLGPVMSSSKARIDNALRALGLNYSFIRGFPSFFLKNVIVIRK